MCADLSDGVGCRKVVGTRRGSASLGATGAAGRQRSNGHASPTRVAPLATLGNLPNALTLTRIAAIPAGWLLNEPTPASSRRRSSSTQSPRSRTSSTAISPALWPDHAARQAPRPLADKLGGLGADHDLRRRARADDSRLDARDHHRTRAGRDRTGAASRRAKASSWAREAPQAQDDPADDRRARLDLHYDVLGVSASPWAWSHSSSPRRRAVVGRRVPHARVPQMAGRDP